MCVRVEGGEGKEQGRLCPGSHGAGKDQERWNWERPLVFRQKGSGWYLVERGFDGAKEGRAGPQWAEESREGPCFSLLGAGREPLGRRGVRPWAGGTGGHWGGDLGGEAQLRTEGTAEV